MEVTEQIQLKDEEIKSLKTQLQNMINSFNAYAKRINELMAENKILVELLGEDNKIFRDILEKNGVLLEKIK